MIRTDGSEALVVIGQAETICQHHLYMASSEALMGARVMPQRYATETRSAAGYRHLLQDLPWLKALLCCAFLGGGGAVPFLGASPIFSIAGFQQRLYRGSRWLSWCSAPMVLHRRSFSA